MKMKAKDYVNKIVESAERAVTIEEVAAELVEVIMESRFIEFKKETTLVSVVREQFSKWRSVVMQVSAKIPGVSISDSMFTRILGELHSEMLLQGIESNVFLAYALNAQDFAAIERAKEYRNERKAYFERNSKDSHEW